MREEVPRGEVNLARFGLLNFLLPTGSHKISAHLSLSSLCMVQRHRRPARPPCRCGACPGLNDEVLCGAIVEDNTEPTKQQHSINTMSPKAFPPVPKRCVVTGGMGFVGRRLVEMLVERGAEHVVAFDIAPKPADAGDDPRITWMQGDLTNQSDVDRACKDADCVWHIAALVGPYHALDMYDKVNYQGTVNVINTCKKLGISKIVMSSSPSTRFDGNDINGLKESELKYPKKFLQAYAESKAKGEEACMAACDNEKLFTVAVAPHQVYGPRDFLFRHNFLLNAKRLRVFGSGKNLVSVCFVDNYCHGLIIAADKLHKDSPALRKFYICTDGEPVNLWRFIDRAIVDILPGSTSLFKKTSLPGWSFMYPLGYMCEGVGWMLGKKLKLTTFSVRMLLINRYFDPSESKADLGYTPIVAPDEAWDITKKWFKDTWLPKWGK